MARKVAGWLLAWQAIAAIACSTLLGGFGASAAPATAIPGPTSAFPEAPTATAVPSPAPTATLSCDVNELLTRLNAIPDYDEFAIGFEVFQAATRQTFLTVWFVDPALDPQAASGEVAENSRLAVRRAAALVHQLSIGEPCFGGLNVTASPVVVDSNYNSWFSGQLQLSALPPDAELTEAQLDEIGDKFVTSFLRDQPPASPGSPPAGSCSWPEAVAGMKGHFNPARQNIGAQFVIEEDSVEAYAQWEGTGDRAALLAPLLNVTSEFRCLHPAPDPMTVIVVDEAGTVRLAGFLPGEALRSEDTADDISALEVVYER